MNQSARPDPQPQQVSAHQVALPAATFILSCLLYVSLMSSTDIDDTFRFTRTAQSGVFVWEASHIWMQPIGVLWHKLIGREEDALFSLRSLNILSAAATLTIAAATMQACQMSREAALFGILTLGGGFAFLQLAPSGHIKLLPMPFFAAGLYSLAKHAQDARIGWMPIAGAGVLWGIASSLLISFTVIGPFTAALFFLWTAQSRLWRTAVIHTGVLALSMTAPLAFSLIIGYYAHTGSPENDISFLSWLFAETSEAKDSSSTVVTVFKATYGFLATFIWAPELSEAMKARLNGEHNSLAYAWPLFGYQALLLLTVAITVFMIIATSLFSAARNNRQAQLFLASFLAMSMFLFAWNYYESEFQAPLLLPIALLTAAAFEKFKRGRLLIAGCVLLLLGHNLTFYSLPKRLIDREKNTIALTRLVSDGHLLIGSRQFTGRNSMYFYSGLGENVLYIEDILSTVKPNTEKQFYSALIARIIERHGRGQSAYLVRILDPADWAPPWGNLHAIGIRKQALRKALADHFNLQDLELAGMAAVRIDMREETGTSAQ